MLCIQTHKLFMEQYENFVYILFNARCIPWTAVKVSFELQNFQLEGVPIKFDHLGVLVQICNPYLAVCSSPSLIPNCGFG